MKPLRFSLHYGMSTRSRMLVGTFLVLSSMGVWCAARFAGDRYGHALATRQLGECREHLDELASASRKFHDEHPEVAWTKIDLKALYPKYVADPRVFRCPAGTKEDDARQGYLRARSDYSWVVHNPDWDYAHQRRGDEMPILACLRHLDRTRLKLGDEWAAPLLLVRLKGPALITRLPVGIPSHEW
jgi:hypothetical protein